MSWSPHTPPTCHDPLTPLPHVMIPSHPSPMSWSPPPPPPCHGPLTPLPHVMIPSHPSHMSWSPHPPPTCHGPLTPIPRVMVPSPLSPVSWSPHTPPPCHGPLTPLPRVMVPSPPPFAVYRTPSWPHTLMTCTSTSTLDHLCTLLLRMATTTATPRSGGTYAPKQDAATSPLACKYHWLPENLISGFDY